MQYIRPDIKPCKWCGYRTHFSFQCAKNPKYRGIQDRSSHCTHCDLVGHLKKDCPRRKLNPFPDSDKRHHSYKVIRHTGKYAQYWIKTRAAWIKEHPANHQGYWVCHYCGNYVDEKAMTLDHLESRSRHPELRFVLSNLVPACGPCNVKKKSHSHDEFAHICHNMNEMNRSN